MELTKEKREAALGARQPTWCTFRPKQGKREKEKSSAKARSVKQTVAGENKKNGKGLLGQTPQKTCPRGAGRINQIKVKKRNGGG